MAVDRVAFAGEIVAVVAARTAAEAYISILNRIHQQKADANVSVKLTAMGLDISEDLCVAVMQKILQRARDYGSFVRIDMESSEYTQRTLDLFEQRLYPAYRENVGIVLQSYLYRTFADIERAISIKARVRLCKGAYKEPETVAFPDKKDVDASYVRCMHELMLKGNYPGIATHDEAIIREAKRFAKANDIAPDRYEFQMLYGVRRDLQEKLVREVTIPEAITISDLANRMSERRRLSIRCSSRRLEYVSRP